MVKSTNTGPHRGNLFVLCNGVTLRQSNGKWEMSLVESQKVEPNRDLYIVGNMTSIINPSIWNMVVVDSTSGQDYMGESCVLIGDPSGQNRPFFAARNFPLCSQKQTLFWPYNNSRLYWPKMFGQDGWRLARSCFCVFIDLDFVSV